MTLRYFSFLYLSVISFFDAKSGRIPNSITAGFFAAAVLTDIFTNPAKIPHHLNCAVFFFAVFYLAQAVTKGLGFGDVKSASVIGYSLGFFRACTAFISASIAGILFFAVLRILKRNDAKVPFAPFMLAGFAVSELACRRFS
ncbi:MAG: prepilin peptidase [Treponema sp.]